MTTPPITSSAIAQCSTGSRNPIGKHIELPEVTAAFTQAMAMSEEKMVELSKDSQGITELRDASLALLDRIQELNAYKSVFRSSSKRFRRKISKSSDPLLKIERTYRKKIADSIKAFKKEYIKPVLTQRKLIEMHIPEVDDCTIRPIREVDDCTIM